MAELIGTHEVPCINDDDYAAYAMYMQCVAEQVESELVTNAAAASAALNRPIAVWELVHVDSSGGASAGGSGTRLYAYNWPLVATASPSNLATLNLQGWWQIGALVHCVSNAPVVGNNRIMSLGVYPAGTPISLVNFTSGFSSASTQQQDITWESNTTISGEDLRICVDVYCSANPNAGPNDIGMRMFQGFSVENTGVEDVTFTSLVWAIFLGDTPLIQA